MSQHRQHRCCTRFPLHSWGRNVFYPHFILNLSEGTGFWRDRNTISSRWEMSRNSTLGDQNAYGLQRICQLFCCQYDYNRHCQLKKKKNKWKMCRDCWSLMPSPWHVQSNQKCCQVQVFIRNEEDAIGGISVVISKSAANVTLVLLQLCMGSPYVVMYKS